MPNSGDQILYGWDTIAEVAGKSRRTMQRYAQRPGGDFIAIGSVSNVGGGLGLAATTYLSSLQNYVQVVKQQISEQRRQAAVKRWCPETTNVTPGQCICDNVSQIGKNRT